MGDLWYLALAYATFWVLLLVYLYSIARRQEGLQQEMRAIQEALEGQAGAEEEADQAEPFLSLLQGEGTRSAGEGHHDK